MNRILVIFKKNYQIMPIEKISTMPLILALFIVYLSFWLYLATKQLTLIDNQMKITLMYIIMGRVDRPPGE
jgi:hypothetical protein